MKGLKETSMSARTSIPSQAIFSAENLTTVQSEIPQPHASHPAGKHVADTDIEKTEGFFRDHPDALLEALLAETRIEFGDPKGN